MADLRTILADSSSQYITKSFARRELADSDIFAQLEQFLAKHGFNDFHFMGEGNNAIVIVDQQNPSLVIRIAHSNDIRPTIPQLLQPMHVEQLTRRLKIEFLKNIDAFDLPTKTVDDLVKAYKNEVQHSGYSIDDPRFDKLLEDGGVFIYEDIKHPGKIKSVFMGADASIIRQNDPALTSQPPTCTADYPTLEDQWREQCRMVEADPRLKKMIGGLPPKLPVTKVKPSISGERTP